MAAEQVLQLLGPEGKPAIGLDVFVYRSAYDSVTQEKVTAGKSDTLGKFSFDRPVALKEERDRYTILVESDEFGFNFFNPFRWEATEELRLRENSETLSLRFVDSEGNPVRGLKFSLANLFLAETLNANYNNSHFSMMEDHTTSLSRVSDKNGELKYSGLPKGSHVYLNHNDPRFAKLSGRNSYKYKLKTQAGLQQVTLLPAAKIVGKVIGMDGNPILGVEVSCLTNYQPKYDGCGGTTMTTEDGVYEIGQLRPNSYSLKAELSEEMQVNYVAPLLSISLNEGEVSTGHDIRLEEGTLVQGCVRDKVSGKKLTVQNAVVSVVPKPQLSPVQLRRVDFKPDGSYAVRVPKGRHTLYTGARLDEYDHSSIENFTMDAKSRGSILHDFEMEPKLDAHFVTGKVVDQEGNAVADALVNGVGRNWGHSFPSTKTDSSGSFRFYVGSRNGKDWLGVFAMTEDLISVVKKVEQGNESQIEVKPKASLTGRLVDGKGEALSDVLIRYNLVGYYQGDIGEKAASEVMTDTDGKFTLPRVFPDLKARVECQKNGFKSNWYTLPVLSVGQSHDLGDIIMQGEGGLKVSGRVIDRDGKPLAAIIKSRGKNQHGHHLRSEADGSFELDKFVEGKVYVYATDTKYKSGREIAGKWVNAGETDVVLQSKLKAPPESVKGKVVDADGRPLSGIVVKVSEIHQPRLEVSTDKEGLFHLKGLYSGWLDLKLQRSLSDNEPVTVRTKTGLEGEIFEFIKEARVDYESLPERHNWIGKKAPEVEAEHWINSQSYAATNHGKVRIVDFWNIYCGPCVANLPKIEKFWKANKDRDLELILLHTNIRQDEFLEFLANQKKHKRKYSMPIAFESKQHSTRCAFQPRAAPTYCVIDQHGVVQFFDSGDWEGAKKKALELLDAMEKE
ncbi:redoxin family protein [Rubritalea sp.]|uniref:redoxin family protein n=1 Tax=Rubritalea sp. TaxID=2109375 RepID=UPI003EF3962C